MALVAAVTAFIVTPIGVLLDEYAMGYLTWMSGLSPSIRNGLLPLSIVISGFYGFYLVLKRKYSASKNETVLMVFVFFLTAFILLTITGIWFRGSGMALSWPWI